MSDSDQKLTHDLGFLEAYTLGLGTMSGAWIFVLSGLVGESAGPASMIPFALGGAVAVFVVLSFSELATGIPRAGGSYYYVNHVLGSFFGTIVGWGMWAGLMFATAFYMLGFAQYLLDQLGDSIPVVPVDEDISQTLLDEVVEYETVCVGATGTSTVAQALYGSHPEQIAQRSSGTVVMARSDIRAPRTIRQAIIQRLER